MRGKLKKVIAGILIIIMVCNCFYTTAETSLASGLTDTSGISNFIKRQTVSEENFNDITQTDVTTENTTQVQEESDKGGERTTEVATVEEIGGEGTTEGTTEETASVESEEENSSTTETSEEEIPEEEAVFSLRAAANSNQLPDSLAELEASGQTTYLIETYPDVLKLQSFSQMSSLEGYTFQFGKLNSTTDDWDFTTLGNQFQGLGSEQFPFKGAIWELYDVGTTFKTNRPMFQYLGSGAEITNFEFKLTNATSGIAQNYIIDDDKAVTYKNVTLTGSVSNSNGAAGSIYGTVKSELTTQYELKIEDQGINVKNLTVSGKIAGGYIGETIGKVALKIFSGANVAKTVSSSVSGGTAAGGIIGKLGEKGILTAESDISIANTVSGNGSVGGIIGICENAVIESAMQVEKSGVTGSSGTVNAGGFVGLIINSQTKISNFQLNGAVSAYVTSGASAGGVIGRYDATDSTAYLEISDIGVNSMRIGAGYTTSASVATLLNGTANGSGGVIGYINGGHTTISNIDGTKFLPDLRFNGYGAGTTSTNSTSYIARSATGGIAGKVSGKDITLSNINLSFHSNNGIAGYCVGDIYGYVAGGSKAKLTDITVSSQYIYYYSSTSYLPSYIGGIAGYVGTGCVMALCGTIDLASIDYTNGNTGLYSYTNNQKGYVAGYQSESLIYLETGAELIKNTNAMTLDSTVWMPSSQYIYNTTIDDIGSYGGVYKNIVDEKSKVSVINYDNVYGQEVIGKLNFENNKYQLTSDADALRLAIALGTFDAADANYSLRFAGNCFQNGATGKSLLAADYVVTGDLDFSQTGIFSLCRNDSTSYTFSGTMTGKKADGTAPGITISIASKQTYGGLFPAIEGAEFSNLKLKGTLYYTQNFGGIAAYAKGNVTFEKIDTEMKMRTGSNVNGSSIYSYGGLLGYYKLEGGSVFRCKDCDIAPTVENIRVQQMAGGIAGYIETDRTDKTSTNIKVDNTSIRSQLTASSSFMTFGTNSYSYYTPVRVGGMFAYVGDTINTAPDSGSQYNYLGGNPANHTYAKLELSNIIIKSAKIDVSAPTNSYIRVTGGLLGYDWNNVEVDINILEVSDSVINSRGHTGGLLAILAGKMDLSRGNVTLDGLNMTDKTGSQKFSAFLVGDGRFALITLDAGKYSITNKTTVSGYSNFDEIVGVNYELSNAAGYGVNNNNTTIKSSNGVTDHEKGGIVNILKEDFKDMVGDGYKSYVNQRVTQSNQNTRYYYNLFTTDYDSEHIQVNGSNATIDSPVKLMMWHLTKYMDSNIQRFITPYFENGAYTSVTTWKLSGDLDMNGYSFYPTQVSGGTYEGDDTAIITLYAEQLETKEADNKKPSDAAKEHYLMHAALFYSSSNITVKNLTFAGTAANLKENSGVLAAGTLSGTNNIEDITCNGIRLANYNNDRFAGLLIGKILDGAEVKINGVQTMHYEDDKKAAAALIGTVGSNTARNIRLTFKNMMVEDEKEKVFRYASFIYHYDYIDNADVNECMGLYTFTKEDSNTGNVTYGDELKYGVDYFDQDRDADLEEVINKAENGVYNPYVYEIKNILVNPRNGDITTGCGTYEHPYIINNHKQLLNLFCYLTGADAYESSMFKIEGHEWKVNQIGNGSADGRCDGSATHTAKKYGDNDFPSRDELRQAYYLITEDLDLSKHADLNDYVIKNDFAGLGTTEFPFAGVIVGKKGDGGCPVITLPSTREGKSQEYYGLIQYMKGAVVKDLTLKGKDIRISKAGGGVAAVSLGGDNIIDNVKLDGLTLSIQDNTVKSGGYIGYVKKGSVIVRNTDGDDIAGYLVNNSNNQPITMPAAGGNWSNWSNCRVIGWVEDGCVLYEGTIDNAGTKMTLEREDFLVDISGGSSDSDGYNLPLSYSFPMINAAYLDKDCKADNKIEISGNDTTGFTIKMKNAAQMEIAALALNSDAFSIYNSGAKDAGHINGYDYTAVCRKAQYNQLNCGISGINDSDCQLAIGSDDNNGYYPYLYWKYMDFTGVSGGYEATQKKEEPKRLSMLNWSNGSVSYGNISIGDIVTTYSLVSGQTYDLTGFGRSFRGFGALYPVKRVSTTTTIKDGNQATDYSSFKADFDGNGATVTAAMERDWDSTINTMGLFNYLTTYREAGFTIQNMKVKNSTFKSNTANYSATGAIAGYVLGRWNFNNITYTRDFDLPENVYDVQGNSYTGGLVGVIDYYYLTGYGVVTKDYLLTQQISFSNCNTENIKITGKTAVGGLLGLVHGAEMDRNTYYGNISFSDCSVAEGEISTDNAQVGGFIGKVGYTASRTSISNYGHSLGFLTIKQTDSDKTTIKNTTLQTKVTNVSNAVGGLIGEYITYNSVTSGAYDTNLTVNGVCIDNLTAIGGPYNSQYYGVGGLCGGAWLYNADISNVKVNSSQIGWNGDSAYYCRLPVGGLFGAMYGVNAVVTNTQLMKNKIHSYSTYAGGLFGDCNVSALEIAATAGNTNLIHQTEVESDSGAVGGIIGSNAGNSTWVNRTWSISDVRIEGSNIRGATGQASYAGGVIGRITTYFSRLNLRDITVGTGTNIQGYDAGGLLGCGNNPSDSSYSVNITMDGHICIGCAATNNSVQQDADYTNIYGRLYAGGLYGYYRAYGTEKSSADVQVQKTRIGACSATTAYAAAGGIAGYRGLGGSNNSNDFIYDFLTIQDCVIAANNANSSSRTSIYTGGLYGLVEGANTSNYASRLCFYHPKLSNNSIGYAEGLNSFETLKALTSTSDQVKLLKSGSGSVSPVHWSDTNVMEADVGDYSLRIGNYVGNWNSSVKHLYILRPELRYDKNFTGSRPAIDVGNNDTGQKTDYETLYGYGYPYQWRKFCHIVYFNPDKDVSSVKMDAGLIQNAENEYLFGSLDSIVDAYDNTKTGADFLDDYNLNVVLPGIDKNYTMLEYYQKCCRNGDTPMQLNGVSVVWADGVQAQAALDGVVGILTNVGGIYSTPSDNCMKGLLEVSVQKAKITSDGKITPDPNRNMQSIVVKDNCLSYQSDTYDYYEGDEGNRTYTISLLSFRYGWRNVKGDYCYETIYVPVFVVERITLYNDLHIMEGEQYSLKNAHNSTMSYSGNVTVAHGSNYTLFAKLGYSNARTKVEYKNFQIEKTLTFQKSAGGGEFESVSIPKGMRFTLVDVETGTPYYYTVADENTNQIQFTDFKDSSGTTPYKNRKIGDITEYSGEYMYKETDLTGKKYGLEQFYIYVDSSEVDSILNAIYRISITTDETVPDTLSFLDRTESEGIHITWIPGLKFEFYEKGDRTNIIGEMSEETKISIDTSIKIAPNNNPLYWPEKEAAEHYIDSDNNNKYLDVAIYLQDRQTGNYVTLPTGTNIIMYEERMAAVDKSVTYCYKDGNLTFPISAVTQDIEGPTNITLEDGSLISNECHIELDFALADLNDYIGKSYDILLELRRTADPKYPLGGDCLDTYSQTLICGGSKEMAVAMEVEDMMDLGINTYHETTFSYEIPFTTKLDFSNMISTGSKDRDIATCAGKDYIVTYRLKKKVKNTNGTYKYQSVGISPSPSVLTLGDSLKLELKNLDGTGSGSWSPTSVNGELVYRTTKRFTVSEIEQGILNKTQDGTNEWIPYVVSWDAVLHVNTDGIVNTDFSNYMVEVTVEPKDIDGSLGGTTDPVIPLQDYYIFTIGKLKTDM